MKQPTEKDLERAQKAKLEYMRVQVQEMELQARYWKAQYETKYFTLEDNKIVAEYNDFIKKTQEAYALELETLRAEQEVGELITEPTITTEKAPD